MAHLGFIFTLIGLFGACFWPLLIPGVFGFILCCVGLRLRNKPKGWAVAGLVTWALQIMLGMLFLIASGLTAGAG